MTFHLCEEQAAVLRDQFADTAMHSMIGTINSSDDYLRFKQIANVHGFETISEWIAHDAYKQADAMMKARG